MFVYEWKFYRKQKNVKCVLRTQFNVVGAENNYIILSPVIENSIRELSTCHKLLSATNGNVLFFYVLDFWEFWSLWVIRVSDRVTGFSKIISSKIRVFSSGTRKWSFVPETNVVFGNFEVSELYVFPIALWGFQKPFRVKNVFFAWNRVGNKRHIRSNGNVRP